jgi:hypothetical protein
VETSETFKMLCITMEQGINLLKAPRYCALANTKLEEVFMYIGKAIRDDQIARNGSAELQEERINS